VYPAKTVLVAWTAWGDPESTDILVVGVPVPQSLARIAQPLNPNSRVGPGLE